VWSTRTSPEIKLVCSGAGAAAIACLDLLVSLGLDPKNVYIVDSKGVIHVGRDENLDPSKARYAQKTDARSLGDAMPDADVFMGLSTADVLKPDMVKTMARDPIILAMANPIRKSCPRQPRPYVPTSSSAPAVRTTRTRSTTCCASPSFSAVRSMSAPPASTRR
jgi:malate dehydrogenase (oxaloacetate-decarboxylating)(NADP+)